MRSNAKELGAYYTPHDVVRSLVSWAVRGPGDRMLDPSCGDGRFLAEHGFSVGVEQDPAAAADAIKAAPSALVHEGDFFVWAAHTTERFECAAGNPPFIRYQRFTGATRKAALGLCARHGVRFSGLASSWAPFLVAAANVLKPGGRLAFVVPAEIGHAPYAAPLLEHLVGVFDHVHLIAVRRKLFPDLSEDCWLLYADGFGGRTDEIAATIVDTFEPSVRPPRPTLRIAVCEWRRVWGKRIRPFLMPDVAREAYRHVIDAEGTRRLSDMADLGIGYVSGDNDFFHLRRSEAEAFGISDRFLLPSVRNAKALPSTVLTRQHVAAWMAADQPALLLRLPRTGALPREVRAYLDTEAGQKAREAYKCRTRSPWYAVPDVRVPDMFLSYMSGTTPTLARNAADCTCTNSLHAVRLKEAGHADHIARLWSDPVVQLSAEVEGHPLGGGMLKLEPREAGRIVIPSDPPQDPAVVAGLRDGIAALRGWRLHG